MIIYKAVNRINGKIYIGQTTTSLKKRIAGHLWENHKNQVFSNALRKYGIQFFDFSIIDNASSKEVLNDKEKYWIKQYNCRTPNGYNLTDGGKGNSGWHLTEETRQKIGASHAGEKSCWFGKTGEKHPRFGKPGPNQGKHFTEDICGKMRMSKLGEKNPAFGRTGKKNPMFGMTGEKNPMFGMSGEKSPMFGKRHTPDTIRKMSALKTGEKNPNWGKHHLRGK